MARLLYRLTERTVRNLDAPGYHPDGGGLYLQISKSKTKSWIFRFTMNGKTRDMGLGSAAFVSLADARARASEARALVAVGVDPIAHGAGLSRSPEPAAPPARTFRDFADDYVKARLVEWKNEKHGAQWSATLEQYAYPVIGDMGLDAIDTPDVLRVLEPIWAEKSETASRLRGRIERILAAASVRGLRPATNPARWAGHLREALPPKRSAVPFAALPYAEIPSFMAKLRARNGIGPRALEFTILTASRSGESRGARWTEFDLAERLWTVPAERMKAGRPHVVPMSERSLEILDEMKPLRDLDGGFVFPGMKPGRPLSDMTLTALLRSMGYVITAHGFRAAFKTWAEEKSTAANVVIEAALAHIAGDKVERTYMRGSWLEKRAALADDWSAYCSSAPAVNVVPLQRAQA
jgi:integrase